MKILVTGGAGFIGSHLVDALIKKGHKVVVVDNLSTGSLKNLNKKAKFYKIDIRNPLKIPQIFKAEKPQVVYHLAAQMDVRKSLKEPLFDTEVNVLGSLNLLQAAIVGHVKKFIFTSSGGAIYGDGVKIPTPETEKEQPLSPYGAAKFSFEKYLYIYHKVYGLDFSILRLANIYGPRQNYRGEAGVVAIFSSRLLNKETLFVNGNGRQTRDYTYVGDVVRAFELMLSKGGGEIYNIGTGRETDVLTIAKELVKISGLVVSIKHRPRIKGEQMRSCLNAGKISKSLKWQPTVTIKEGLRVTFEWFENNKY